MRIRKRGINSNYKTMITGFKDPTKPLNDFEMRVVRFVVPKLKRQIGKKNVVKSVEIRRQLLNEGYDVSSIRLRKIIHHIRVNKLVENLVSTSQGYYRAKNQKEVDKYVESLQQRINSIEKVKKSFL